MQLTQKHKEYWQRNLRMTDPPGHMVRGDVCRQFAARELNEVVILGFPLGFYMGAQGSLVIYVIIIWYYAKYMNTPDQEYGCPRRR